MLTLGDLNVDPNDLNYEFFRSWTEFRKTTIQRFLVAHLECRIVQQQTVLENAALDKVGELQGAIRELKAVVMLLRSGNVQEQLQSTIKFLELYGKRS
jgi:hypothetical protein